MRDTPNYPRLEVEFRWLPVGTEMQDGTPFQLAIADVDAALIALHPDPVKFISDETRLTLRALIDAAGPTWPPDKSKGPGITSMVATP